MVPRGAIEARIVPDQQPLADIVSLYNITSATAPGMARQCPVRE